MTRFPPFLTVATFNIRLGIQCGLAPVAETLHSHSSPDIVAIQEIGVQWLMGPKGDSVTRLSELLDLPHHEYAITIEESRSSGPCARYGHAVFSRWPITDPLVIDLPREDDEPRILLRSVVKRPAGPVEVLSTHLSHLDSDRPRQGRFLRQWLTDRSDTSAPRFLMGDLNATSDSEPWLSTLLDEWTDADRRQRRPTFPAHAPKRRIDYVLASGAELQSVTVPEVLDVSDHRPVIATWSIPEA